MYYKPLEEPKLAPLPKGLIERRKQQKLDKIFKLESPREAAKDRYLAQKTIERMPGLTREQKSDFLFETQEPSSLGRTLAMGVAGVAAPLLLGYAAKDSSTLSKDTMFLMQAASVPIAALGGATLFDLLSEPRSPKFSPALPMSFNPQYEHRFRI